MAARPGDGIRSIKTTPGFRITNFELYMKPNVFIGAIGLSCLTGALGYIAYMKHKYKTLGYYVSLDQNGQEHFEKKKSKWD